MKVLPIFDKESPLVKKIIKHVKHTGIIVNKFIPWSEGSYNQHYSIETVVECCVLKITHSRIKFIYLFYLPHKIVQKHKKKLILMQRDLKETSPECSKLSLVQFLLKAIYGSLINWKAAIPFNISWRSEQNMFQNTCALTSPTFSSVGNLCETLKQV